MADPDVRIRPAVAADFQQILALNAESVHFLSPLDDERLTHLHSQAAYHRVATIDDCVVAFLLAFCQGADYDSPNYRWFAERYAAFLYVDRVVVSPERQGNGLGARLYGDLFAFARQHRLDPVACEFDVLPPNETSRHFHAAFGFVEVGSQWVNGGNKQVSLQVAKLGIA